jgi:hypothetical protein
MLLRRDGGAHILVESTGSGYHTPHDVLITIKIRVDVSQAMPLYVRLLPGDKP